MYVGKYAFINLSEDTVSFDEVVSGTKPEPKEVRSLLLFTYIYTYIHKQMPYIGGFTQ